MYLAACFTCYMKKTVTISHTMLMKEKVHKMDKIISCQITRCSSSVAKIQMKMLYQSKKF